MLHGGQQHDAAGGISGYSPKAGNFSQVGGDVIGISIKRENMVKNKKLQVGAYRPGKTKKKRDETKSRVHRFETKLCPQPCFVLNHYFPRQPALPPIHESVLCTSTVPSACSKLSRLAVHWKCSTQASATSFRHAFIAHGPLVGPSGDSGHKQEL